MASIIATIQTGFSYLVHSMRTRLMSILSSDEVHVSIFVSPEDMTSECLESHKQREIFHSF